MRTLWITILVCFSILGAQSQYFITNFNDSNSGLTNNNVFSITFDKDNTAYFGLYDYLDGNGGIARYDGVTWDKIRLVEDTLHPHINNISDVLFAPNNDMWICSYSTHGSRITKMDSSGFSDVTPAFLDLASQGLSFQNGIWIIAPWTGLYEYNYDSLKWLFYDNFPVEAPYNYISSFNIDSDGTNWIGIGNRNVFLYKDTVISTIKLFPELPPKYKSFYYFNDIEFDKDGSVWFGTNEGLIHWFSKGQFMTYDIENSDIQTNDIYKVKVDSRGNIWTGSLYHGLSVFDEKKFAVFDTTNALIGNNQIRDIEEDRDGNIWIATWGAGVYKFTYDPSAVNELPNCPKAFEIYPNPVKASGEFTIRKKSSSEIKSFHLCSLDGKVVQQYDVINKDNFITIRELGVLPGFYMGMITDTKGNQSAVKIMVVD